MSLNLAVDSLLKREFDQYRVRGTAHPIMEMFGIDALPFRHPELSVWRDTPSGIRSVHTRSGFEVFGLVDDLWQTHDGKLLVVDYKAVGSKPTEVSASFARQIDIYRWLFARNDFIVADHGYLLYAVVQREQAAFDRTLQFALSVSEAGGDWSWIEDALLDARACLVADVPPPSTANCEWCAYRASAKRAEEAD